MTTGNDRRRFSRFALDFEAELSSDDRQTNTRVTDISLKGALVERPRDFPAEPGSEVKLAIHGDNDTYTINMTASVSRLYDDHIGLECTSIDIDSITHLRRLIELNLGDSSLLNRELVELCSR